MSAQRKARLGDAVLGMLDPVVVTDAPTLTRYADALRHFAAIAAPAQSARLSARADLLSALASRQS